MTTLQAGSTSRGLQWALAAAYRPAGTRTQWAVVAECPACGFAHLHRASSVEVIAGAERVGSCGRRYLVDVRQVHPAREGVLGAAREDVLGKDDMPQQRDQVVLGGRGEREDVVGEAAG